MRVFQELSGNVRQKNPFHPFAHRPFNKFVEWREIAHSFQFRVDRPHVQAIDLQKIPSFVDEALTITAQNLIPGRKRGGDFKSLEGRNAVGMRASGIAMVEKLQLFHGAPRSCAGLPTRRGKTFGVVTENKPVDVKDLVELARRSRFAPGGRLIMPQDMIKAVRADFKAPVPPLAKKLRERSPHGPGRKKRAGKRRAPAVKG